MKFTSRLGQQLVEYLLLFTIVIVILVLFITLGPFKKTVTQAVNLTIDQIDKEAAKL